MSAGQNKHIVADAGQNNLVDRFAPNWSRPWLHLMRADRPIGIWLLFWPCAWSLTMASMASQDEWLDGAYLWRLMLFLIGAAVMRGAGCVWNDIADREIDAQVERTRNRPLPSGQVSVGGAVLFMVVLSLAGLWVLLQFNRFTILLGLSSLLIVVVYPFMKRLTNWPQAVLGLAFGWGALMGWASRFGRLDAPALLLYAGTICWIIGYDTIYAHQDREDDALIGLCSTALRFGEWTKLWLTLFFSLTIALLLLAGLWATPEEPGRLSRTALLFLGMAASSSLLIWQLLTLDINDAQNCLERFRNAHMFGGAVFLTLLLTWGAGTAGLPS